MKKIIFAVSAFLALTNCQSVSKQDTVINPAQPKNKYVYAPDTSAENLLNIPYRTLDTSKKITTFGFGSCNDQNETQPLWKLISNKNFDLFLMMGDNVYASRKETKPILNQYIKLNENSDYKKLRETTPFLATWDDHDYGVNDGGADNSEKDEARKVYLNYWRYLKTSLPKNQNAIYHSRIVGTKKERIQFILLDTRWNRSALVKNPDYNPEDKTVTGPPKIYIPTTDTKTQILGDEQWQWLESELKKPADLRILVSSIQIIANDHYFEKWGNFPHERDRFFQLLQKTKTKNLVILSGDRHLSSIAKHDTAKNGLIYEITSSGLNKPSRATEPEIDATYTAPSFLKINYGQATVDWIKKTVQFDIVDVDDKVQLSQSVKF
jgi:alkaline phosphatase D